MNLLDQIDAPLQAKENVAGLIPDKDLQRVNEILDLIRNHYTQEK